MVLKAALTLNDASGVSCEPSTAPDIRPSMRVSVSGIAFLNKLWTDTVYISGAQRPARGPHPARDDSGCGPRRPTRNVAISYNGL